jgi:RNA polymerase sigma factor (TIGR02999 family)
MADDPVQHDPSSPSAASATNLDRLFEEVYPELRRVAERYIRDKPAMTVVQPTVLVHEVFVKLAGDPRSGERSRTHFFAVAATAMRQILVDFARRRSAAKRGGDQDRVTLAGVEDSRSAEATTPAIDVIAVDAALNELSRLNPRHAKVVEMRFFAGMEIAQIATALGVSERTVTLDWAAARAWLYTRLREGA